MYWRFEDKPIHLDVSWHRNNALQFFKSSYELEHKYEIVLETRAVVLKGFSRGRKHSSFSGACEMYMDLVMVFFLHDQTKQVSSFVSGKRATSSNRGRSARVSRQTMKRTYVAAARAE
jgi:hypothetical protein